MSTLNDCVWPPRQRKRTDTCAPLTSVTSSIISAGADGDALHALLCGARHNLRMILRHLRVPYCALLGLIAMVAALALHVAAPTSPLNALTTPQG